MFFTSGFSIIYYICYPPGPLPRKESDTKAAFGLSDSTADNEWSASASYDPSGNSVSVSISSSPNAPIGLYSLTLDQDGQKTSSGQFTLLFNPWCTSEYIFPQIFIIPNCSCKAGNVVRFEMFNLMQLV